MSRRFKDRLREAQEARRSLLCVGLDPDPERLPTHLLHAHSLPEAVLRFNRAMIEATSPYAAAFKVNFAFFEALGDEGWRVLRETVAIAAREHLVIADAKRGDIGNSARFYASAVFEDLGCDACTVSPYMGADSIQPFLAFPGRAAYVLVRTSNPGAAVFQEQSVEGRPLYMETARHVTRWSEGHPGEAGFVVGATDAAPVAAVRDAHPDVPLLIPGVGAQGGDAETVLDAVAAGYGPVLINSSRQILYASGGQDFAEAAAREAERSRDALRPRGSSSDKVT